MTQESIHRLKDNIKTILKGKEDQLMLMLVGLIAEGHILIEDVPGVGKTMIAKALAASIDSDFHRLQCTPDLTPTDVTGFYVYERQNNSFAYRPGPVVTNILLVDEINRAVPRTQSSLLEAMEEKQITVDGQTMILPHPFMVIATQNPIEHEGTFPLPEAQLDRFLLKISMGYPDAKQEESILLTHGGKNPLSELKPAAHEKDVREWQAEAGKIYADASINTYIVELVRATREHPSVSFGASPRASLALYKASKALAFLRERKYVIPDDVKYLASYVLSHRLSLKREDRLRGIDAKGVLEQVLSTVPAPVEAGKE